jgi:serine/threonine-protein kinase
MGVVYEARDPALSRNIALKAILPAPFGEKEAFEARFFEEARIAARLSHPGIVVVHDVGRDPASGVLYIALEHLRGKTLAELAEEGPLDWREVCRLGAQIARALYHAHEQGVIHRDMKPANVMLLPSGETKIMDFGIARIETARFRLTNPGEFIGTPLYTAPEQATTGEVDARTDVFSLGSIAYTLLAGRPAFAARRIPDIVDRVVRYDPPPPSRIVPGIPVYVDRVIGRAMAKEPAHRYPDAQSLAEDLEEVLAGRAPAHVSEVARVAAAATWAPPRTDPAAPGPAASDPAEGELLEVREDTLELALRSLVEETATPAPPAAAAASASPESPPPAAPEPKESPAPHPSRRRRAWIMSSALLIAGLAIGYGILVLRGVFSPGETAAPLRDAPSTTALPAPPEDPSPAVAPTPVATPTAAPTARPRGAGSRAPRETLTPREPGRLRIDFDHPLKYGILRVWVDGEGVIEQKLTGTVRKKGLVFKLAQGSFRDTLQVSPGVHKIRFQVAWDDNVKAEEITGTFRSGQTLRLEADLGRIRRGLNLEWK